MDSNTKNTVSKDVCRHWRLSHRVKGKAAFEGLKVSFLPTSSVKSQEHSPPLISLQTCPMLGDPHCLQAMHNPPFIYTNSKLLPTG